MTGSDPEASLEWFLNGFTARDLAEPLPSLDEEASFELACRTMAESRIGVLGIRRLGRVVGWIGRADLQGEINANGRKLVPRPLDPAMLVGEGASLNEVVGLLGTFPHLLVKTYGQVGGVIERSAIDRPPVRMWLFGLITISEQRVTRLIEELFPAEAWTQQISSGRLSKARELQQLRQSRGQQPSLLDCLQVADKGQIVARSEVLRARTRFHSRSEVERFVQALQDLRNNLAHAQDISPNWDVIREVAANVHQIVCGNHPMPTNSSISQI
jgi:hypothetical protein